MESDKFVEFSTEVASLHGIEIAIILGFFLKCYSLTQGNEPPAYPSLAHSCSYFSFWNEDKIRHLISDLYLKKLI